MSLDKAQLEQAWTDAHHKDAVISLLFILRDEKTPDGTGPHPGKTSYTYSVQRAQMREKEIAAKFREVLVKWLVSVTADPEAQIVPFDPFSGSDAQRLETIPTGDVPLLSQLLDLIQDGQAHQVANIKKINEQFLKRLWAYSVVASVEGRRVLYFRKFQASRVVHEETALGFSFRKGFLSKLEDPAFNFDENADALVIETDALVLQKTLFEQIFDYAEHVYTPLARKAVEKIREIGIVFDPDGLAAAIEADDNKLKKAASIGKKIDLTKVTWDNLKKIQQDYGVPLVLDEKNHWIVNQPADAWNILKVLNDDYLHSEMTGERYEVQSKRRVERPMVRRQAAKKAQPVPRKETAKARGARVL